MLVQTYLRAGALDHAAEARAAFPSSYSTDPALRSQVDAWLALSRGELTQAATALQTAGDARAGDLLRGWLSEASRDTERARAFYRRAAQDSRLLPRAHTRLARMELRLGRERDAVTVMASVLEQTQNHPEFVPVAIEANLAVGDLARARALSDTLIAAHPNDPRVLIARAHVHMAAEEWEQAARHLETAVQSRPSDADAQANLGRAAQHLGRREQAEEAFRAALAIEARLPDALLGLLELYIEAEEADHAEPILEEIDAAALRSERVDLLRSRFLVLAGKGHGGVLAMRAILRRRPRSSELRMNMAELYMQAGLFTQAARQFEAATGFGADEREAAVGIGLAQILAKRNRIAEVALERVRALELAAGGPQSGSAEVRARTLVLVGHLSLYGNHISPAREAALEALELQPECVEAHMLLAAIAEKRGADPSEHWRAAAAGSRPAPAAIGHMARAAGIGDEGCRLARQYVRAAPRGDLAEAMREMQRDCRRR
ncbi:MAG: tetratricopeptide repeat protein [Myxococcales bacterium]|nr:tetratricopeptide repeat protein [Myxococcales bacterium]